VGHELDQEDVRRNEPQNEHRGVKPEDAPACGFARQLSGAGSGGPEDARGETALRKAHRGAVDAGRIDPGGLDADVRRHELCRVGKNLDAVGLLPVPFVSPVIPGGIPVVRWL
jgi:hypothetical protein